MRAALLALVLLTPPALAAAAGEIVVIRSTDLPAYRAVEQAALADLGQAARSVQLAPGNLVEQIRVTTGGAKVLLALGPDVAAAAAAQKGPAVLHVFVPNPAAAGIDPTLPSVPTQPSLGFQVRALRQLLPKARRVGVIYDPAQSSALVAECDSTLVAAGLVLVRKEVAARAEVPSALEAILPTVDLLWILPDPTVVGLETLRALVQAPLEAHVPVIGYGESQARAGALLSAEARWDDVGRKAAAAARRLVAGQRAAAPAPEGILFINARTAGALGLKLTPAQRAEAAKVFE